MPEESGPLVGYAFTDEVWRAIIGPEAGIIGDVNGTAYRYTLSTDSDAFVLGSTTQDSTSVVGGALHRIPLGQTQSVTVPGVTSAARTDIIAVRYDKTTFSTPPGPCRLVRIAGAEGSGVPAYDAAPPGIEDLPLFEVTRRPGESLVQATVRDRRVRTGPVLYGQSITDIGNNVPLGTVAHTGTTTFRRVLDAQSAPKWEQIAAQSTYRFITGTNTLLTNSVTWLYEDTVLTNDRGIAVFPQLGSLMGRVVAVAGGAKGVAYPTNVELAESTPSAAAVRFTRGETPIRNLRFPVGLVFHGTAP